MPTAWTNWGNDALRPSTDGGCHERGMDRRQFLVGTTDVGLGAACASIVSASASADMTPAPKGGYPQFTWATVATAADVGDTFRTWNANEARFMANHLTMNRQG